ALGEVDGARLGAQAQPVAGAALGLAEVALVPLAHRLRLGLLEAALELRDDALEAHRPRARAVLARPAHGDALVAGAVEQHLALLVRELLPRLVERDLEVARERLGDAAGPARVDAGGAAPGLDGAAVDRQVLVGHDELGVDLHAGAEAVAVDAHA